jgi:hypothetical protein
MWLMGGSLGLSYTFNAVLLRVPRNMRLRKAADYTARGSLAVVNSGGYEMKTRSAGRDVYADGSIVAPLPLSTLSEQQPSFGCPRKIFPPFSTPEYRGHTSLQATQILPRS